MRAAILYLFLAIGVLAAPFESAPLQTEADLSKDMVAGIRRFLEAETARAREARAALWTNLDQATLDLRRAELCQMLGIVQNPAPAGKPQPGPSLLPVRALEIISSSHSTNIFQDPHLDSNQYQIHAIRWPVLPHYNGEGIWIKATSPASARIIIIPDADQTPEDLLGLTPRAINMAEMVRALIATGAEIIIPALVSRDADHSGNPVLRRYTNQPHREWIYRQAYELGQHIIGYEVQMIVGLVDFFAAQSANPIGVAGYGEGGLLALHTAALDPRISSTLVSGYFGPREKMWEEPIYRNIFGFLNKFGDAELAAMIAPRPVLIEYSIAPQIEGPPPAGNGRSGAAPGKLDTASFADASREALKAQSMVIRHGRRTGSISLFASPEYASKPFKIGTIMAFADSLKIKVLPPLDVLPPKESAEIVKHSPARQKRLVEGMVNQTQETLRYSERYRDATFWDPLKKTKASDWPAHSAELKRQLWEDVLGKFTNTFKPLNVRSRQIYDTPAYAGYDVVLDVFDDVFAWGILLVPKGLQPGERRPVVVCQHGLEGLPKDVIDERPEAFGPYKAFAARLAEQGFITFAPHNPYRGRDDFRAIQRQANPLGKTLFSIIISQHTQILNWLETLTFVDSQRIAFYGLSYGGKTAMRVPPVLDKYCLSICSADFNEWVKKVSTTESPYSYLYTGEYDMPEWNLGHTYNYAEMAALIAPRPFMVERGHDDGVAPDEWVAHEYSRVRRFYNKLGIGDRTEIEFFDGPHTINGQGTYAFLRKHLNWPPQK